MNSYKKFPLKLFEPQLLPIFVCSNVDYDVFYVMSFIHEAWTFETAYTIYQLARIKENINQLKQLTNSNILIESENTYKVTGYTPISINCDGLQFQTEKVKFNQFIVKLNIPNTVCNNDTLIKELNDLTKTLVADSLSIITNIKPFKDKVNRILEPSDVPSLPTSPIHEKNTLAVTKIEELYEAYLNKIKGREIFEIEYSTKGNESLQIALDSTTLATLLAVCQKELLAGNFDKLINHAGLVNTKLKVKIRIPNDVRFAGRRIIDYKYHMLINYIEADVSGEISLDGLEIWCLDKPTLKIKNQNEIKNILINSLNTYQNDSFYSKWIDIVSSLPLDEMLFKYTDKLCKLKLEEKFKEESEKSIKEQSKFFGRIENVIGFIKKDILSKEFNVSNDYLVKNLNNAISTWLIEKSKEFNLPRIPILEVNDIGLNEIDINIDNKNMLIIEANVSPLILDAKILDVESGSSYNTPQIPTWNAGTQQKTSSEKQRIENAINALQKFQYQSSSEIVKNSDKISPTIFRIEEIDPIKLKQGKFTVNKAIVILKSVPIIIENKEEVAHLLALVWSRVLDRKYVSFLNKIAKQIEKRINRLLQFIARKTVHKIKRLLNFLVGKKTLDISKNVAKEVLQYEGNEILRPAIIISITDLPDNFSFDAIYLNEFMSQGWGNIYIDDPYNEKIYALMRMLDHKGKYKGAYVSMLSYNSIGLIKRVKSQLTEIDNPEYASSLINKVLTRNVMSLSRLNKAINIGINKRNIKFGGH